MQDNRFSYYPHYQGSSDPHYSVSAPANSASIDTTSTFTCTGDSVDLQEWSPTVTPIAENRDGPLTAPSGVAGNFDYVAHASCHRAAPNNTLLAPHPRSEYTTDAHSRPLWLQAAAEAVTTHAHAPHAAWKNEKRLGFMQLHRSQVPSGPIDLDACGQSWSQCGDDRHAVEALVQPALLRDPHYPVPIWAYIPALPEVSASSTSQAHIAGLGNAGPWVADPVLCQATSPSNRRRHCRRPHARAEHVNCEKCLKTMRRQSLKRHIREVHDHIKRPHSKFSSATQAGP